MAILHVRDEGLNAPVGVLPHANPESANKDKLQPYLVEEKLANDKKTWVLNPFLDIMHRIFRNTLFPRIGDKDKVHAYLLDLMLIYEKARLQQTEPLDVSHIMWCELQFAVFNRKVPIYGPYLFLLISKTWGGSFQMKSLLLPTGFTMSLSSYASRATGLTPLPGLR